MSGGFGGGSIYNRASPSSHAACTQRIVQDYVLTASSRPARILDVGGTARGFRARASLPPGCELVIANPEAGSGAQYGFVSASDNGSCYVARDTRAFARDIGLLSRTTPLQSPQSNGMAEAFVRTFKRDYVRVADCPDAVTVLRSLPICFDHYNEVHPHRALQYQSPRQFIRATLAT